jgi:hypothetical protein
LPRGSKRVSRLSQDTMLWLANELKGTGRYSQITSELMKTVGVSSSAVERGQGASVHSRPTVIPIAIWIMDAATLKLIALMVLWVASACHSLEFCVVF